MIDFSIIIPTKNIPNLLQRCLDSIPLRDDIQILIIDDNSDESIVDFDNYPGMNRLGVELFFLKESRGAGYARNIGLENAIGKWIIFADSDDFFSSDFSYILDSYKVSNYDIIYFNVESVDSESLETTSRGVVFNNYVSLFNNNKIDSIELGVNYCVPWGKIIRKSLVDKYRVKFSETMASNDVFFSTQITIKANKVCVDTRNFYCVTFRRGSLTTTPSVSLLYDRLNEGLKRNQLLIDTNHKKYIGSVAYILYCIYKVAGFKDFFKAIWIVLKSSTPLWTGCSRWGKTFIFLKRNKIHDQNC